MSAPKPTPSKPLSYTPPVYPQKNSFKPKEDVVIQNPSIGDSPLFKAIMQDEEFVDQLATLRHAILFGDTEEIATLKVEMSSKQPKPEAPRTEKQGPMTHRPFQYSEGLRELQRSLHRNEGKK